MSRAEEARRINGALKKLAASTPSLSINQLRVLLALERIAARLVASKYLGKRLLFKGGFVLFKAINSPRYTRDLDALAIGISPEEVEPRVKEALDTYLEDGFWFGDIVARHVVERGNYGGLEFNLAFQIGGPPETGPRKLSRINLDIGFGDSVVARPMATLLPTLVEAGEPVSWSIYPLESIFSEKLETLVSRGSESSRAKDLFDLVALYRRCEDKKVLGSAIGKTFKTRATPVPSSFSSFFQSLNFMVLQAAWSSVTLSTTSIGFDECIEELTKILVDLDRHLAQSIQEFERQ